MCSLYGIEDPKLEPDSMAPFHSFFQFEKSSNRLRSERLSLNLADSTKFESRAKENERSNQNNLVWSIQNQGLQVPWSSIKFKLPQSDQVFLAIKKVVSDPWERSKKQKKTCHQKLRVWR